MEFKGKLLRVKKCDIDDKTHATVAAKKKKKVARKPTSEKPYVPHYPHPRQVLQYATDEIMPYLAALDPKATPPICSNGASSSSHIVVQKGKAAKPPMYGQLGENGRHYRQRHRFIQVAELIEVDQSFLTQLNEQLLTLESRPAHRRHSQIDVSLKCVMVLPDVTLPPPDDASLLFSEDDLDNIPTDFIVPDVDEDDAMTAASTIDLTDEEQSDALLDELEDDTAEVRRSIAVANKEQQEQHAIVSALLPPNGTDCEVDSNEEDETDIVPAQLVMSTVAPRLRRLLSSYHRNIFDCCFRNICVEIKPKIGFKPKGPLIPDIKKKVCRFCMHQHYKKSAGKVEEISQYCPLDLFSRDPVRIRKALRALQRTPQNNFKVFVRSNQDEVVNVITGLNADALPKGASQSRYSQFCRRKRMGFRRSCHSIGAETEIKFGNLGDGSTDSFEDAHHDELIPDVVELITEVLMKLEILDDLKKMQLLDHISVDGMWHIQKLLHRLEQVATQESYAGNNDKKKGVTLGYLVDALRTKYVQDREEVEQDEGVERAGSLARCLAFLRVALHQVPDIDVVRGVKSWEDLGLAAFQEFYRQLLQRFQVATTLKDCSMLLCLRRSADDKNAQSRTAGLSGSGSRSPCTQKAQKQASKQVRRFEHLREYEHPVAFRDMTFNCVVAVVDLDVKSHKSVEDYYRLDEKIVDNFLQEFGDHGVEEELCRE
uniref:inositol-pentakisphosphate 2-kinase n=1 Tax=Globisporangium ultimum (strain ATCC 200006 / CBS 805.95 / DAOM BR144) TaxID=431595 RepID=K3WCI4_GLOUD